MEEKNEAMAREETKHREPEEVRALVNRLNRIEGQVRGVRRMIEQGAACPDVLIQASAVRAALDGFSRVVLSEHIKTCVENDIRSGKENAADELAALMTKMMK